MSSLERQTYAALFQRKSSPTVQMFLEQAPEEHELRGIVELAANLLFHRAQKITQEQGWQYVVQPLHMSEEPILLALLLKVNPNISHGNSELVRHLVENGVGYSVDLHSRAEKNIPQGPQDLERLQRDILAMAVAGGIAYAAKHIEDYGDSIKALIAYFEYLGVSGLKVPENMLPELQQHLAAIEEQPALHQLERASIEGITYENIALQI